MINQMFEALGISTFSRDPAPPSVNPRHQPKPSRASTAVRFTRIMDTVSASVPGVSAKEKIYDFLVVAFVR